MPDTPGLGDLWVRASRIREECEIVVDVTANPPGWSIVLRPQRGSGCHAEGRGEHLIDALGAAIKNAEARGFGRRRP